jgi:hypothetical protein
MVGLSTLNGQQVTLQVAGSGLLQYTLEPAAETEMVYVEVEPFGTPNARDQACGKPLAQLGDDEWRITPQAAGESMDFWVRFYPEKVDGAPQARPEPETHIPLGRDSELTLVRRREAAGEEEDQKDKSTVQFRPVENAIPVGEALLLRGLEGASIVSLNYDAARRDLTVKAAGEAERIELQAGGEWRRIGDNRFERLIASNFGELAVAAATILLALATAVTTLGGLTRQMHKERLAFDRERKRKQKQKEKLEAQLLQQKSAGEAKSGSEQGGPRPEKAKQRRTEKKEAGGLQEQGSKAADVQQKNKSG